MTECRTGLPSAVDVMRDTMDQRPSDMTSALSPEERARIWVVVPAYQEASTIGAVTGRLTSEYPNVVVVDDGSSDATASRARSAGAVVIRHAVNRGQGAALQTGIDYALGRQAEILVTFDADGQHAVDDIQWLVRPILDRSSEIVLGSRFLGSAEGMSLVRRCLLRTAVAFTRWTSGMDLTDVHNGLRAFSRGAALEIEITSDRMAHASELLDQIGRSALPCIEVPVRIRYTDYSRAKGQSSLSAIPVALDYLMSRVLR
jgi:glycosyltransferase involved in cell wall biosynthesis